MGVMETHLDKTIFEEVQDLRQRLKEANDTLDAIRTGQIDALVVKGHNGHVLYTLKSADFSYRIFIEKMTEGAVTLSSSGLILYCNSKFAAMVDQPLSRVLGSAFYDFVAPECKRDFQEIFLRAWTEDVKNEILLLSHGGNIPVLLSLTRLALEEGISLSILLTDLTAQKKTEKELKAKNDQLEVLNDALAKSNNDLQQFASVASHDLQEPLRKIQVFSKFLKDKTFAELPESSRNYLEKIIASASRMKILILDILSYSRLSASDMHFEPVDLGTILNDILEDFEISINEVNADITIGPLPVVEVNRGQMRQVFQNLLSNALKFTRPGIRPVIVVKTKELHAKELGVSLPNEGDYCRISIRDNGIGFDEKYASSIFSLFEKLNSKAMYEGSGIGLAIAKKIIDKHHGVIFAKSKEGEGAEFNIILPLKHFHAR
jgi:PAS domain S-box-containing protein